MKKITFIFLLLACISNSTFAQCPGGTCSTIGGNLIGFSGAGTDVIGASIFTLFLPAGTVVEFSMVDVNATPAQTPDTGVRQTITVAESIAEISGLSPDTEYAMYFRRVCGTDCTSAWVQTTSLGGTFSTLPATTPVVTAGAIITDDGGETGNYTVPTGENSSMVYFIEPENPGEVVTLRFTEAVLDVNGDVCRADVALYEGFSTINAIGLPRCGEPPSTFVQNQQENRTLEAGDEFTSTDPSGGLTLVFRVRTDAESLAGFIAEVSSASVLSTDDFAVETGFTYSPNPVNDFLNLKAKKHIDNVTVYNMLGQEVLSSSPKSLNSSLDMSYLKSGPYFVKVTIEDATKTVRLIKN